MPALQDIFAVGPHEVSAERGGEYGNDQNAQPDDVAATRPRDLLLGLSRILGTAGRHRSERLQNGQQHYRDQQQHRQFVEPAIPDVAVTVAVMFEIGHELATINMVSHQGASRASLMCSHI